MCGRASLVVHSFSDSWELGTSPWHGIDGNQLCGPRYALLGTEIAFNKKISTLRLTVIILVTGLCLTLS